MTLYFDLLNKDGGVRDLTNLRHLFVIMYMKSVMLYNITNVLLLRKRLL